jgi:hypothetical protein
MQPLKVYDGVLTKDEANFVENFLVNPEFPWFFQPKSVSYSSEYADDDRYREISFFSHILHKDYKERSNNCFLVTKALEQFTKVTGIKVGEIIRSQANLTHPINGPQVASVPHIDDFVRNHNVLIYYANDSDGETIIYENGEIAARVPPKKNRFVIFDGSTFHSGMLPVKNATRLILNVNLEKTDGI